MAHCHACHARCAKDVFPSTQHMQGPEDRACENCFQKVPHCRFLSLVILTFDPKFELGQDFCTVHLTVKFHFTFNHSKVIVLTNELTNKQTPLKTSISLRYAMLV